MESNFKNNPKNRLQDVSLIDALNSAAPSEYPVNTLDAKDSSNKGSNQYLEERKESYKLIN